MTLDNERTTIVELAAKVSRHPDRKAVAAHWPRAVDRRLDQLVERLRNAGERTDRTEVLAALVCATDPDVAALAAALRAFRTASVRDVLLDAPDAVVARLPVHRPGPRVSRDSV